MSTAANQSKVATTIAANRSKLSREFDARLRYVLPSGRLRVMVSTAPRTASLEQFVTRSVTAARWYGQLPAFLATVTPDQLATLLASRSIKFVDPDHPIEYSLGRSAPDVRVRAGATFGSVPPDGSQNAVVSLALPAASWSGDAPSQGMTIANILVDFAGARPVCTPTTCNTFTLHVTDPGDLRIAFDAGTVLVAVEIERPDGATSYETGSERPVIAIDHAQPGNYVIRTSLNSIGPAGRFTASATLSPSGPAGGDGVWSFDPTTGGMGSLQSAATDLSVERATGAGVGVAIIDSGIDRTHPDFGGFTCTTSALSPCESRIKRAVTIDAVTDVGVDIGDDLPTTEAASGHGTHVAGIVAGNGYMARDAARSQGQLPSITSGAGIPIGVAPQASLVSIKNGDTLWAGLSSFGLSWVLEHHASLGIRVLNNSWGCVGGCAFDGASATGVILKALYDAGVLVAFAAGNDGGDETGTTLAGNSQSPYVLGVANYDAANHLLNSSSSRGAGTAAMPDPATWTPQSEPINGHRRPDIAAPGTAVAAARSLTGGAASTVPRVDSADATGGRGTGTGGYVKLTGTSMSTPHVAGAAAVLFSACPAARVLDVMRALMVSADATRVRTTDGSRVAAPFEVGYGGMDVRGALDWMRANVAACTLVP